MARAYTIDNVKTKKFKGVPFEGPWADAIGDKVALNGSWLIFGKSGSGKTTFILQTVKMLSEHRKVLYNSLEEGLSQSMQIAFKKAGLFDLPNNRVNLVRESIEELEARLSKPRSPQIIVIDSIPYTGLRWNNYLDFCNKYPHKLFIWIDQNHPNKQMPRTTVGDKIYYDSHVKIRTEGYRAFIISRLRSRSDAQDYIDIWPAQAEKYWAEKN